MTTRQDVIGFCLEWEDAYEDYPFSDGNWAVLRHKSNKKAFAFVYEYQGRLQVNVKCKPEEAAFWRGAYPGSVLPGYHMNKTHWNTILLNGSVPGQDVQAMIAESRKLTLPKQRVLRKQEKGGDSVC